MTLKAESARGSGFLIDIMFGLRTIDTETAVPSPRIASPRQSISLAIATVVTFSFAIYGVIRVWQQSFLAIDGQRYFNVADDALITLRYAWNLAHGNGLVWNPGERVEGITNVGWAVYSAVLALFLDRRVVPLAIQLTGVLTLVVAAIGCWRIYRRMARSDAASAQYILEAIALLAPLCYVPLINWTLGGMETGPLAALVTMAVSLMVGSSSAPVAAWLLGVAYAVRPDVAAPALVLLGIRWLRRRSSGWAAWHRWSEVMPFIGVALAVTLARYAYYGSFVPNTYVLKVVGTPVLDRIEGNGYLYVSSWFRDARVLVGLFVASLVARPTWDKVQITSVLAAILAYCLYVGGDAYTQWRFLAPYVPLVLIVVLSDVPALSDWLAERIADTRLSRRVAPAVAIATAALFLVYVWTQTFSVRRQPSPENIANVNTAIFLSRVLRPHASVGVFFAGTVPYYTGLEAVDFLGKSDPYIARLPPDLSGAVSTRGMRHVPGHDKGDLNYSILSKRPTYVAGFVFARQDLTTAASPYYVRAPVGFATWPPNVNERTVFLLRDSPDVDWQRIGGGVVR